MAQKRAFAFAAALIAPLFGCGRCDAPDDRCGAGQIQNGDAQIIAIIDGHVNEAGGVAHVVVSLASAPKSNVTLSQATRHDPSVQMTPASVVFTPADFTNKTFTIASVPGVAHPDPIPSWTLPFDPTASDDPAWNCLFRTPVFDTIVPVGCGDGTVEDGEDCEPAQDEDPECPYGSLACTYCDDTCHFAAGTISFCGDGAITNNASEVPEECDPALAFTDTCQSHGFISGTLSCGADCNFDESQCSLVDVSPIPDVVSAHMCILDPSRPGGRVRCWGRNDDGEATPPLDAGYVDVENGARHSCAMKSDGVPVCWGFAEFYANAPGGSFAQISLGAEHTCGRRGDGTLACWGHDDDGQSDAPADSDFVDVAAGGFHTCALHAGGAVSCWGLDLHGESDAPAGSFVSVVAGTVHSCALRTDHTVACWGRPDDLYDLTPGGTFASLVANGNHTCAVDDGGAAFCWGDGYSGVRALPAEPLHGLSLDDNSGCGIAADDTLRCWGPIDVGHPSGTFTSVDARGPCGLRTDGTLTCWSADPALPPTTPPAGTFVALSATFGGGCALRTDHHAVCFRNQHFNADIPPLVPPVSAFTSIGFADGDTSACGLLDNGNVLCWGDDSHGQLDAPSLSFAKIAIGGVVSCGIRSDDASLACWGARLDALGHSTVADPPAGAFIDVAVGGFACGVRDNGSLACWGELAGEPVPVPPAGNDFVSVSVSGFACGVHGDGSSTCFGTIDRGAFAVPAGVYSAVHSGFNDVCAVDVDGHTTRCWGAVEEALNPIIHPNPLAAAVAVQGVTTCIVAVDDSAHCWREDDGLFDGPALAGVARLVIDGDDRCIIDRTTGFPSCSAGIAEPAPQIAVTDIGLANHRPCALTAQVADDPLADPPVIGSPGGVLLCWNNAGDVDGSFRPPGGTSTGPWQSLAVGPRHVCVSSRGDPNQGTVGGDVTCFGANDFGQSTPGSGRFAAMGAVDDFTCGASTVGGTNAITCWGNAPFIRPNTDGFVQLTMSVGPTTVCSIDDHQGLTCFGALPSPAQGFSFSSAEVGDDHVCGIAFGQLYCSGAATYSTPRAPP